MRERQYFLAVLFRAFLKVLTDPNYLFLLLFFLGTVSLSFLLFTLVMVYSWYEEQFG